MKSQRLYMVVLVCVWVTISLGQLHAVADVGENSTEKGSIKGDLVQMTFTDTNLQDVLRSLSALRPDVNIVMNPDVKGKVALLNLHNVTWEKALQIVAESNNLEIIQEPGNIYRVRRATVSKDQNISIKLLTVTDVGAMTDEQVAALLPTRETDLELSKEDLRNRLKKNAQQFIKELVVRGAPALDVIQELADIGDQNLAITPEAQPDPTKPAKPITLKLKNMALVDALRMVAVQGGLSCNNQNGVWVVMLRRAPKEVVEPLILETFQVNFLALDDGLTKMCQSLVSERGQVSAGKNKVLVVRDTADGVEAVRRTLEAMDHPTPQVLIEARFYELNKLSSHELGIDWKNLGSGTGLTLTTGLTPIKFERDLGTTTKRFTSATIDFSTLESIIKALDETDGAQQLSNPKVLVSSDEQATIHIGEQRPILKASLDSAPGGDVITVFELDPAYGGEKVQDEQLVEREDYERDRTYTVRKGYLDLGTKLTVAPSVKTEDEVYIKVVPELTTILDEGKEISTQGLTAQYPTLFSTRVRTEFTIQSTQTIAIGGLVSERNAAVERKVPVLGYIPYLGRIFRYNSTEKQRTETIIFLTVTVVPSREMTLTSGIPIKAKLIQDELPVIREEDEHGPGYQAPPEEEKEEATKEDDLKEGEMSLVPKVGSEPVIKTMPPVKEDIQQSIEKAAEKAALTSMKNTLKAPQTAGS